MNANPKTDEHGMVTGMLCVAQVSIREHASLAPLRFRKACRIKLGLQDISERKKAAAEMQRLASDLTRLVDTANAPIFGIDNDGRVNEWNQTAAKITGYSKAEVMGSHLVDKYISPDYRASVSEVLSQALRGIERSNFEFVLFTKSKSRVEVLLNANPRRDANGKVIGVIGVGQVTVLSSLRNTRD